MDFLKGICGLEVNGPHFGEPWTNEMIRNTQRFMFITYSVLVPIAIAILKLFQKGTQFFEYKLAYFVLFVDFV